MFIDQDQLENRIMFALWRASKAHSKMPVGCHAYPKRKSARFAGIGFVNPDGTDEPKPMFDIYVGEGFHLYDKVNEMVRIACEKLGKQFVDMK